MSTNHTRPAAVALAILLPAIPAAAQVVLSTNFDTTIPAAITPGVATITGVQGYANLGHPGYQFGGSFLRSPTGNVVTVTLTSLPAHSALNIDFLFAAIDSLDGTGSYPEGDFLRVTIDGVQIFRESFANATAGQDQSYIPPPGVQLARRIDLGFSGPGSYYTDSAYDMSLDPVFHHRAHTASTVTLTFQIEGPGIQDLNDESWAMDNLRITLEGGCGTADFDGDGDAGTDFDIQAFFSCLGGDCCATCFTGGADFNNDGDTGTDADIESFFRVLGGGPC